VDHTLAVSFVDLVRGETCGTIGVSAPRAKQHRKELSVASEIGSVDTWIQAGGAVSTVVLFLRYLMSRDTAQSAAEKQRHEVVQQIEQRSATHAKEITDAFVKALDQSAAVVSENTRALGRVHEMMDRHERARELSEAYPSKMSLTTANKS